MATATKKMTAAKTKPVESKAKAASSTITQNKAVKAKPTVVSKATQVATTKSQTSDKKKNKTKESLEKVESEKKPLKEKQEEPKNKQDKSNGRKKRTRGEESTKEAIQNVDEDIEPSPKKKATRSTTSQKEQPSNKKQSAPKSADDDEEEEEKSDNKVQNGKDDEDVLSDSEIIKGFSDVSGSDDDANSSDEEDQDDRDANRNAPPIETVTWPNSKDDKVVQQRLENVKQQKKVNKTPDVPATLYVGRLPHGFYEDQMKSYFEQFGDVSRVRVSRNRKTGAPKHYAFIEFVDQDVAKIVQETMNNYLIDGRLLQVREVPKDKVHPKLWIGANKKFRKVPNDRRERVRRSQPKTDEQEKAHTQSVLKRQSKRRQKLKADGIEYDFEGYTVQA